MDSRQLAVGSRSCEIPPRARSTADWRHNFAFLSGVTETELSAAPLRQDGETMRPSATDGSEATFRIWGSSRPLLGFALRYREGAAEPRDAGFAWGAAALGMGAGIAGMCVLIGSATVLRGHGLRSA